MKLFIQIMAVLGWATFVIGLGMRLLNVPMLLNAEPVAWWRASMALLTLGILYALMDIREALTRNN